jgi:hypothetical protein
MWMIKKIQLKNKGCSICKCFEMFLFFQLCVESMWKFWSWSEVNIYIYIFIYFAQIQKEVVYDVPF